MVIEGNRALGGEHTIQYTDVVSQSHTPETYTGVPSKSNYIFKI